MTGGYVQENQAEDQQGQARPSFVERSAVVQDGYTLSCSPRPGMRAGLYKDPDVQSEYTGEGLSVGDTFSATISFIDTSGNSRQFIGGDLRDGRGARIGRHSFGLGAHQIVEDGWFFLSSEWSCTLYGSR